jgi:hypothetical protein
MIRDKVVSDLRGRAPLNFDARLAALMARNMLKEE